LKLAAGELSKGVEITVLYDLGGAIAAINNLQKTDIKKTLIFFL
jgi:hypothetical protein